MLKKHISRDVEREGYLVIEVETTKKKVVHGKKLLQSLRDQRGLAEESIHALDLEIQKVCKLLNISR